MIELLMIQPEKRTPNLFRRVFSKFRAQTVLTMIYLAAFVNEDDYNITFVNEYSEKIPYDKKFDLVAITVNTLNALHCYEISAKFRAKGIKVVMGGPHVTLLPDEGQEHCDHLILQEGEITWPQFLEDFKNGTAKKVYEPNPPMCLSNLPSPRWDLLDRKMVKGAVIATRGCPYNCSFCALRLVYDPTFRKRPVEDIVKDIQSFPVKFFAFWDDNLFADKEYAKELMRALIPLKRTWGAMVALRDCNDEELLTLAKTAGCQYFFIGIESFSEEALKQSRKGINRVEEYETIITNIHRHKIMVYAGIIFGFDSDTLDVFDSTFEACEKLGIDFVDTNILTPYPHTTIYKQFESEGRIFTKDWGRYGDKMSIVYEPKNMTADELVDGYNRFIDRFYSLRSILRRRRVSRANFFRFFRINLGFSVVRYRSKGRKK